MATVTVDEKEYDLDDLSDEAKAQIQSIQLVDQKLIEIQQQAAILQTARNAYINALADLLPDQD